ncbi:hypothetical protein VKT23_006096 [Stygiomarasmius scandens]|uniref:Uncharacterized protein n=1 Tax=Marasmiellus scandens TaxID=2682957 RepID=A0ABR1JPV4_9AGAR
MMMSRITLNLKKSAHKKRMNDPGHVSSLICISPASPDRPSPGAWSESPNRFHYPDPVLDLRNPNAGVVMHIEHATYDDEYVQMSPQAGPSSAKQPARYIPPYSPRRQV